MTYDVIVVGAGIMGLSAAAELTRRGQRIAVLDRYTVGNPNGSSHGETRVIRTAYFEHPGYVPLAQRAWKAYEALGAESGAPVLQRTGGLYIGAPDSNLISGSLSAATLHGLDYRYGEDVELQRLANRIVVPDGSTLFWEDQCGVLFAGRVLGALTRICEIRGSAVRVGTTALYWRPLGNEVEVMTSKGAVRARSLVLCPGPWTSDLLPELELPLTVTRQVTGYSSPQRRGDFAAPGFPVVCVETDTEFFYILPCCATGGPNQNKLKLGSHVPGTATTPASVNRNVGLDDLATLRSGLRRFLPEAVGPILTPDVCLYTMTADGHFIIDIHPDHKNVVFATGGSGHAFKFGPVIGEAVADLAMVGKTSLPIEFLRLDRFSIAQTDTPAAPEEVDEPDSEWWRKSSFEPTAEASGGEIGPNTE